MPPSVRLRAGAACTNCRTQKSKCNAEESGIPCTGCVRRGLTDCHFIPTTRGKYARKLKSRPTSVPWQNSPPEKAILQPAVTKSHTECQSLSSHEITENILGAHDIDLPISDIITPNLSSNFNQGLSPGPLSEYTSDEDSWNGLFQAIIKGRYEENSLKSAPLTYLAESFPLATASDNLRNPNAQLQYPSSPLSIPSPPTPDGRSHPSHLGKEELSFLEAKQAFELPPPALFSDLLNTFIHDVYRVYPVVVLQDFIYQWKTQTIPWVLCHAVCLVGAAFCDAQKLHAAGFQNRKDTIRHFYNKAKLLFDFGYEKDKLVLLQAVTLLTFWPHNTDDVWMFDHWISFGVTLSESLGIHRPHHEISTNTKNWGLLKRLWWVLVIRDAYGATLFGRPPRINRTICNVEHVVEDDFTADLASSRSGSTGGSLQYMFFPQAAKLAMILREIIVDRLEPSASPAQQFDQTTTRSKLSEWRAMLPEKLNWDTNLSSQSIFIATLSILYDMNLIMINTPKSSSSLESLDPNMTDVSIGQRYFTTSQATYDAAERIIELAGTLALKGNLNTMPHEIFAGLLMAEAVSYKNMSSMNKNISELSRSQVNYCQMIFNNARGFWDLSAQAVQLFSTLLSKRDNPNFPAQVGHVPMMNTFLRLGLFDDLDICQRNMHIMPILVRS